MKQSGKQGNKSGGFGSAVLIFLGVLLIAGALGLVLYNFWDSRRAQAASREVLEALDEEESDLRPTPALKKNDSGQEVDKRVEKTKTWLEQQEMPTRLIDGYEYIGTIEFPSLNLRLPVMKDWDYTRLKISPCRYSGSYYTDNLVICAHNYDAHFSPVKWIDLGADVYFVTVEKVVYHYVVTNRETLQPTAIEQMIGVTEDDEPAKTDWDLTLFTCNTGGQTRCAVRCIRAE